MLTNQATTPILQSPDGRRRRHDTPVISVHALHKRYGDAEAVRGIDLEIRRGEIFAFLGPNGAGKTTTVEILEGFRQATRRHGRVLGRDPWRAPRAWRERIGIVLQESEPEPGLTRPRVPRAVRRLLPRSAAGRRHARARRPGRAGRRSAPRRCPVDSGAGSTSRSR